MFQKGMEKTKLGGIIRRKRQGDLTDSQFFLEMGGIGYNNLESIETIKPHEYTCYGLAKGILTVMMGAMVFIGIIFAILDSYLATN